MKRFMALFCTIIVTIAIPLCVISIIENYKPVINLILIIIMLPGYVNCIVHLLKKNNLTNK